jgi:uncharacterized protein
MILVDSGILIAAANAEDRYHEASVQLIKNNRGALLVSPLVLTEVCYMIGKHGGSEAKALFLDGFAAGALVLAKLSPVDVPRMAQLIRQYPDLDLDAADTSIVALAERLGLDTVATIDRRDFAVIRPAHLGAFTLIPERLA